MARLPKIRIREKDKHEYRRLVRNTRAKIRRVQKNYGIDLSGEVNIPALKDFKHRKEFNQFKKEMNQFTDRRNRDYQFVKNKYGVVASKTILDQAKAYTKEAQDLTTKFIDGIKNHPTYRKGEPVGTVEELIAMRGESEGVGLNPPRDFNFDTIQTPKKLDERIENMARKSTPEYYQEAKERMQNNYIEILKLSLNSGADPLIEKISGLDPETFYQMWLQISEIDFNLYDSDGGFAGQGKDEIPTDDEVDKHVSSILSGIEKFEKYHKDNDLNTFP